jgi:hypothetical protein
MCSASFLVVTSFLYAHKLTERGNFEPFWAFPAGFVVWVCV